MEQQTCNALRTCARLKDGVHDHQPQLCMPSMGQAAAAAGQHPLQVEAGVQLAHIQLTRRRDGGHTHHLAIAGRHQCRAIACRQKGCQGRMCTLEILVQLERLGTCLPSCC